MTTISGIDPLELLELAQELSSREDVASVRTSCDRAYYAAFLFTRNTLESAGKVTPFEDGRDHRHIPATLKQQPEGFGPGNDLSRLYGERNRYTYDTNSLPIPTRVKSPEWIHSTAERIIQFVTSLTE